MKKSLTLSLAALLMLLASACREQRPTPPADRIDTLRVSIEHPLCDDAGDGTPQCRIHLSVEQLLSADSARQCNAGEAIAHAIFGYDGLQPAQALDSFANSTLADYSELLPQYVNDKEASLPAQSYNHEHTITTAMQPGRKGVWNYVAILFDQTGGAHPNTNYVYLNIDQESGRAIELSDIFAEGYEEPLNALLLAALARKAGTGDDPQALKEKGYLQWSEMFPSQNFLLTPDSIKFLYNSYDIAPYAMGRTELGFGYEELSTLLKK